MKVVREFSSRSDAEMAKGFLASAGIKAHVSIDDEGGLHPALGMQGGARLLVADPDLAKAKEVLAAIDGAEPLKDDSDPI